MLDVVGNKKVVVFNTDVLCRKKRETPLSSPSFGGDATAITVFENDEKAADIYMNLYNDGTERDALIMHAGGYNNSANFFPFNHVMFKHIIQTIDTKIRTR